MKHFQLWDPTENMLTNLPDIDSFGWATKYINHPSLMPDLSTIIKAKSDMQHKYIHQKGKHGITYNNHTLEIFQMDIWKINIQG